MSWQQAVPASGIGRLLLRAGDPAGLAAALAARPDGVVVDLAEGRFRPGGLAVAQDVTRPPVWAAIRPLPEGFAEDDLARAMEVGPAGILLTEAHGVAEIERLGARLAVAEALHGRPDGETRILASLGDNPAGLMSLERLHLARLPRLAGIVGDPARLARRLGCPPGSPTVAAAEARLVIAAAASGVASLRMLPADGDEVASATAARESGFGALLVEDPACLPAVRLAFGG